MGDLGRVPKWDKFCLSLLIRYSNPNSLGSGIGYECSSWSTIMMFVHSFQIPIELCDDPQWGIFYPVLDGDESSIEEVGEPLKMEDLVRYLENEDEILVDREDILSVVKSLPRHIQWTIKPAWYVGEYKIIIFVE